MEWKMLVRFMAIWNSYIMAIWNILGPFGTVVVIWYIFSLFGTLYQEKSGNPAVDRPSHFLIQDVTVKSGNAFSERIMLFRFPAGDFRRAAKKAKKNLVSIL
jgi:hypothetical protein